MTNQEIETLRALYLSIQDEITNLESNFLYGSLAIIISILASAIGYYLSETSRQKQIRFTLGTFPGMVIIFFFFTFSGGLIETVSTGIVKVGYRKLLVEREIAQHLPEIPLSIFPEHSLFYGSSSSNVPKLVAVSNRLFFPYLVSNNLYYRNIFLMFIMVVGFTSIIFGLTLWSRMGLRKGGCVFFWFKALLPALGFAVISAFIQIVLVRLWW